jgi:hypothetical protein
MRKILISICAVVCIHLIVPAAHAELLGNLGGMVFKPKVIQLSNGGGIVSGDISYDTYRLVFRSEDDMFARQSASVTIALPKGVLPDGLTFRLLADTPLEGQPSVEEGLPEVQGWRLEDNDNGIKLSHVFRGEASVKVEFGKRQGTTIGGKISLVVPVGAEDGPDAKPSSLTGEFSAVIGD